MAILFGVEIDVVREESIAHRNQVTENAVEDGAPIADHIRNMPRTIAISAILAGLDWESRYERLRELADGQEVGEYIGSTVWENVVIASFDPTHTAQISNGVRIEIALKQVEVATLETREFIGPAPPRPETTKVDPVTGAPVETAASERGRQQAENKEVNEETTNSWLMSGLKGVGLFGG